MAPLRGREIKVKNFKVNKCLGVGHLGQHDHSDKKVNENWLCHLGQPHKNSLGHLGQQKLNTRR